MSGGKYNLGLFELGIGRDGITGRLGSGGADISMGTLYSSSVGFLEASKVLGAKASALFGDMRAISTIDSTNMLAYNGGRDLGIARDINSGKIKVNYGDIEGGGKYSLENGEITITEELLGGDLQTSAMLASMMSHEGTHAQGVRVEAEAHGNAYASYQQICENFGIGTDDIFTAMMSLGMNAEANQEMNTGDTDWWKLMFKNGRVSLDWDLHGDQLTLPDGSVISTELQKGERGDEINASVLARLLLANKGAGAQAAFAESIREKLRGKGLSLAKDSSGNMAWMQQGSSGSFPALMVPNAGISLDITDSFDSIWQSMASGGVAAWVQNGASGISNQEVGFRTDSFFATARMGQVMQEMKGDVVRLGDGTVDWAKTLAKFKALDSSFALEADSITSTRSLLYDYSRRLSELRSGAYGLIGDLSSPAGPGDSILGVTQRYGDKATVDYIWRTMQGGGPFHPGIDFAMDGVPVYAGLTGRIAGNPTSTSSTTYATKAEYDSAKLAANPSGLNKYFWHKGGLRFDDVSSSVGIDIGFQFGTAWVSSGLTANYYHMGAIPSALTAGTLIYPTTQLGTAGNYGMADGPHLDLTLQRPATAKPSLFEMVFGNNAIRPWNSSTGALHANAYYFPEWMTLFSNY